MAEAAAKEQELMEMTEATRLSVVKQEHKIAQMAAMEEAVNRNILLSKHNQNRIINVEREVQTAKSEFEEFVKHSSAIMNYQAGVAQETKTILRYSPSIYK